ncbi:MAG: GWxTD domain-containing protein [Flavobacteriales bacterium]|jgi:GWxTD domain-containing protein
MKTQIRSIALITVFILCAQYAFAMRAYFDYRVFDIPGQGPFVEVVLSFDGQTFETSLNESGTYNAHVGISIIITQNDKVIDFRKASVEGPSMLKGETADFLSLERFALPNGMYDVEIEISDINNAAEEPVKMVAPIKVNNLKEGSFISDIQFISAYSATQDINAFSKSGYDLIPYISSYFPSNINELMLYAEIYNLDKVLGSEEPLAFVISVRQINNTEIKEISRIKRINAKSVSPQLHTIDIRNLPTGEYKILLEARDRNNSVIAMKERFFTRNLVQEVPVAERPVDKSQLSNSFVVKFTNPDSLREIIYSLNPIALSQERNTINNTMPSVGLQEMQSFFYTFWYKRNPSNPEAAWLEYKEKLKMVDENFGTRIKEGWETDRGRVYLQYGPPNTRIERPHDPDYWPFEIWHYYETNDKLHDRRFLFYNTSLGEDYELLHSDVPQETKNMDWPSLVRQRAMNTPGQVGRNSNLQDRNNFSGDELQDLWYNPY